MKDLLPDDDRDGGSPDNLSAQSGDYVVVARRYRPQTFEELIGQDHVTRGLQAAIASGRVGHAFLFTGARGTGKTSTARILAKALNCVQGPTPRPCNECDICNSISTGDDVDALEIDGASNRRIDEIRQLRQNIGIRPSRARFKIYIIDEVHMLTGEAFNALLKTLEEPPEHVKFIFCTTEPDDIPITILSRCQRFDFASVEMSKIAERLAQIAAAEKAQADPDALLLLARRAAGSMRDSQSLLEQLLALGNQKITVSDVHEMLGTAGTARLSQIVRYLAERDTAGALAELDTAVREGVDVGQLLDQLIGFFRDLMVSLAGCPPEAMLYSSSDEHPGLLDLARQLGMETILSMMQILDQTIARLRYSMHARALAELAIVRICTLADLQAIPALIAELRANDGAGAQATRATKVPAAPTAPIKKKSEELADEAPHSVQRPSFADTRADLALSTDAIENMRSASPRSEMLSQEDLASAWQEAITGVGGLLAENAKSASIAWRKMREPIAAPDQVVATFTRQYNFGKQFCERPANLTQLQQGLCDALGRPVTLLVATCETECSPPVPHVEMRKPAPARQRMNEKAEHPWVKRATELFDARVVWMEEPQG
ncbi:MAG: DNA polymerase III subunit gamma/tau [Phycisphaerales bacterium]|nr:DNA polymerase III subunit gamma/tau [Phycisphaerales bacterium]